MNPETTIELTDEQIDATLSALQVDWWDVPQDATAAFARAIIAADRAQRQAQPLTEAVPHQWHPGEIAAGYTGIRWVTAQGVFGRPTADDVRQYLADVGEPEQRQAEPVAWAVYWGIGQMRKNSVHFERKTAEEAAAQIKSATEIRPLYTAAPPPAQVPLSDEEIRQMLVRLDLHTNAPAFEIARETEKHHRIVSQP